MNIFPHELRTLGAAAALTVALLSCSESDDVMGPGPEVPVASVRVSPAGETLHIPGDQVQLTAVAIGVDGNPVAGKTFTWTSEDPTLLVVNTTGLATVLASGTEMVRVVAAVDGVTGHANVMVDGIATLEIDPQDGTLPLVGDELQLSAVARTAGGEEIPHAQIVWESNNPTVVAVDPTNGMATAVSYNRATIVAHAYDVRATADLTVGAETYAVDAAARLYRVGAYPSGIDRLIGSTGLARVASLAEAPDGTLWAISSTANVLYRIDPATGHAAGVGRMNTDLFFNSLAADQHGNLYAVTGSGTGALYRIDRSTAQVTFIGTTGYTSEGDLAFAPDGQLYLAAPAGLVRLDVNTGHGTLVGNTGSVYGLRFVGEHLIGLLSNQELVEIDRGTGHITFLRRLSFLPHDAGFRAN